jgi:hypothetical protein
VCDVLEGNLFGTCNAYCEAMDCDSPDHKASDKACHNKLKKWTKIAGDVPIPCNAVASISFLKTVNVDENDEIPVGDELIYSFEITNSGNVPLVIFGLSDPLIPDALGDCTDLVVGKTLEVNETISCMSDMGELFAANETVENTAVITGAGLYGTPVSAQSTAIYTGAIDGPPPIISNLRAFRITFTTADIEFETVQPTSRRLVLTNTATGVSFEVSDSTLQTFHNFRVSGLTSNITYSVEVIATNAGGISSSAQTIFTTLEPL